MDTLVDRLARVEERVAEAITRSGRAREEVLLLAVSKKQPLAALRQAASLGLREFGENYVQELVQKHSLVEEFPDLRLHLIGHLQRNKAKQAAVHAAVVHTVDDAHTARALSDRVIEAGRAPLPVLIEVNLGEEAQKGGCRPASVEPLLRCVEGLAGLDPRGLMTIPPVTRTPAGARVYFEQLRALREALGGAARLPELSMGMSADLEEAIAAGSTIVRVGTAIFGDRA